ncbi:MAG: hypothetical protein ACLFUS_09700 [Candidatus Sumerlaeia bacterium]
MLSTQMRQRLGGVARTKALGAQRLKGKSEAVDVFELAGLEV